MSKLPRLKVQSPFASGNEADICDLEEAKHYFDYGSEAVILVDGQVVNSYEELIQIAAGENYKDKEFIEVVRLPLIAGG